MEEFIYALAVAWNLNLETIPRFPSYFCYFPHVTEWVPSPSLLSGPRETRLDPLLSASPGPHARD